MAIIFARPRLLRVNGVSLTDHNRQELGIDLERIETRQRMANGTLRRYFVADKRTFNATWQNVPTIDSQTVDGFSGGASLENMFNTLTGTVTLGVTLASGSETNYSCMITSFQKTVVKRFAQWEMWNISMSWTEV